MSGNLPGSDKDSMEVGDQDTDQVAESVELEVAQDQQPVSSLFAPALEVIQKLIQDLTSELEVLRKDAREKEVACNKVIETDCCGILSKYLSTIYVTGILRAK
ncbi:hypothetical protein Y032_0005g2599 [Ancylostoma ceylanicum]|uniref:Uncharacterized protein n=1 Tax=Ancylostoma ceylanicum TaxID=53326 RepID=A0A016VTG6_9BILA|nr:hypothetical protein Y032_0005g2599 [Ancylostoma ceylanicum]